MTSQTWKSLLKIVLAVVMAAGSALTVQAAQEKQRLLLGAGVPGQNGLGRQEGQGRAAETALKIIRIVGHRLGLVAQQRF